MDQETKNMIESNITSIRGLVMQYKADQLDFPSQVLARMIENMLNELRDLRVENIDDKETFNYITDKMNDLKQANDICVKIFAEKNNIDVE